MLTAPYGKQINRSADGMADEGVDAPPMMLEPYHCAAPAVIVLNNQVCESNTYASMFRTFDPIVLTDDLHRSKSKRYDILDLTDAVWNEVSTITPQDVRYKDNVRTIFKLNNRCMVCPKASQETNEWLGAPYMYPHNMCPLCRQGIGEEFHIFGKCAAVQDGRIECANELIGKVRKAVVKHGALPSVEDWASLEDKIYKSLFPTNRIDFLWGSVPLGLKVRMVSILGDKVTSKILQTTLKYAIWDMYANLYGVYMEKLRTQGWDFAARLKRCHNLTPRQLSAKHKEMKARKKREEARAAARATRLDPQPDPIQETALA